MIRQADYAIAVTWERRPARMFGDPEFEIPRIGCGYAALGLAGIQLFPGGLLRYSG
jgi:hypothetical protein